MSKFCKICHDSKKAASVVESHNVRERGRVVCPTLLATECRFCKATGHTPKFCPKLKERERRIGAVPKNGNFRTGRYGQRRNITPAKIVTPIVKVVPRTNKMADIYDDDEPLCVKNISKIPWGDGPGEDEPFQRELLVIIQKFGRF